MNRCCPAIHRLLIVAALFMLVAILPPGARASEGTYSRFLPIIFAPPGVLVVEDEAGLHAALEAANAAGQPPRIELAADIILSAPLPALDHPGGGTAVIAGNDHSLDGGRLGSVLRIAADTTAVIERLTITNGSGSGGEYAVCGGGIYSEGRLTLRQTRVVDNWARRGGGICIQSPGASTAVLVLEASVVSDNTGFDDGGGLYAGSPGGDVAITISDSLLRSNTAKYGGGLYAGSGGGDVALTISNSLLQDNTAHRTGGGIFAYAGKGSDLLLTVEDSTLSGNRVTSYVGGAIFSATYQGYIATRIDRSTIAGNRARDGAGFFNEGSSEGGGQAQAIIRNSTFSGNVASGAGGAIANEDYATGFPPNRSDPQGTIGGAHLQLLYSTVTNNEANQGSGLWNEGWLQAVSSIIAGNEADGHDCAGLIRSSGYNLDGDGSCGLDATTDVPQGVADLRPLALVAPGQTATHALGPGSAARDRIPPGAFGCDPAADTDQRGVRRPQPLGGLCDIGAFEG